MKLPSTDMITVKCGSHTAGRMMLSPEQLMVFEYDAHWLKEGFALSPFFLPLKASVVTARREPFHGNFGVFADSLPDGWGNLLLDRVLRKNGLDSASLTTIQRLSLVGNNGMGALTYEPAFALPEPHGLNDLNEIAAQIKMILNDQTYMESVDELFRQAGSSAGARPKVLMMHEGEHWLVKFPSALDPHNIGGIEFEYSQRARRAGIEMPETRLFEGKYFGVKRFDREGEERIHMISAAGLLHADFRLPSLDYTELIKATRALTGSVGEVEKMYRLMVFNVLIGNNDDHARNFSFIYKKGEWKCSPAYDLLPSVGMNGEHCTAVAGSGRPDEGDMLRVAAQCSIENVRAKEIIAEVGRSL